jgi:hypothetical protein
MRPNVGAPNFIKHTLMDLRSQINPNTMVVALVILPITIREVIWAKFNKETLELNDTIGLMDLTDVYRVFHSAQDNICYSQQHTELSLKYTIS